MMNILATGQSNMRGKAPADGPPLNLINSRVTVWNNTQELGANGTAFIAPPAAGNAPWATGTDAGANNLAGWFAHRAALELSEDIKLVIVAVGATAIAEWNPSTGNAYAEIDAVYTASGQPAADLLLWHQGESDGTDDANTDPADYKTAFNATIAALRSDGFLAVTAPVIVGSLIKTQASAIDTALQELAAGNALIYYADLSDLEDQGDGVHFTGAALHYAGFYRYWDQYRSHIGLKPRVSGSLLRL